MNIFKKVVKYAAVVLFCLLFLLVIFPVKRGSTLQKAKADSLNTYPTVCLGGWQNPGNAAGQPDVTQGSDSFSGDNSAVLDQADAQIFCGSFQSSDESRTPTAVTLHFSWNVVFPSETTTSVSTDTDSSAWSDVLDATSTSTSTPSSTPPIPATSTPPASATSTDNTISTETPSTATSSDNSDNANSSNTPNTPSSSQDVAPPPASTTSTTPDQSDANQATTSFLNGMLKNSLALFIQKTFADSTGDGENFVDVSYSLNGTVWQDLGQVSSADWQDYSVTIPVSSWDDINKLQIQLNPLLTVDAPTIYLDGMWLEVDYNQTLSGILQNGANAALDAVSSLSGAVNSAVVNAVNGTADALTNVLPSNTTDIWPQNSSGTDANPQVAAALPPLPPPPPAHQYVFQLGYTMPIDAHAMAWVPADQMKTFEAGLAKQSPALPMVALADPNTIRVTGTCSETYYTILIFPDANDYVNNPALAFFNKAWLCASGSFDQTIADMEFPPQLATGTYYLMVANQGKRGPWQPYPVIYPIVLGNATSS